MLMNNIKIVEGFWEPFGDKELFVISPCQDGFDLPEDSPLLESFYEIPHELAEELGYSIEEM